MVSIYEILLNVIIINIKVKINRRVPDSFSRFSKTRLTNQKPVFLDCVTSVMTFSFETDYKQTSAMFHKC